MPGVPLPMPRIIFLNRFYWPEEPATAQLLADLAEALAVAGNDVTVITSRPDGTDMPYFEVRHRVSILRVACTRWRGLAGKAVNFLTFYLGALWRLLFTVHRGDHIVALTDPPLLGVGAWLTARLCGAHIFHWVQDIYPEVAMAITRQSWLGVIRPLRNLAWRRSDGCVTLGSDMAATLARAGVSPARVIVSPNWAPAGLSLQPETAAGRLRAAWKLEGKFVVAYSGNLGCVHDLDPVLEVAVALREETGIAFVFIGSGAQRGRLESQATKRGLHHVHFHPAQPRARLAESLALGDVHLVTLLPGCEQLVFPSKLYGVAAVGRPVVFIGPRDSEVSRLVTECAFGRAFVRDDIAGIADCLRELRNDPAYLKRLGATAAEFGRDHSGPARAASAWAGLFVSAS